VTISKITYSSGVVLEKLIVPQQAKNFVIFV